MTLYCAILERDLAILCEQAQVLIHPTLIEFIHPTLIKKSGVGWINSLLTVRDHR